MTGPGRGRLGCPLVVAALALALSACGEDTARTSPPGSPDNPVIAEAPPGTTEPAGRASDEAPGYRDLVTGQSRRPAERFSPCRLVTHDQARSIAGRSLLAPLEAPQGPTCIYRSRSGEMVATLAVQTGDLAALRSQMRRARRVRVADRPAYCGRHGQPVLYASLPEGRVLSVAAPCSVARRFAVPALRRLGA